MSHTRVTLRALRPPTRMKSQRPKNNNSNLSISKKKIGKSVIIKKQSKRSKFASHRNHSKIYKSYYLVPSKQDSKKKSAKSFKKKTRSKSFKKTKKTGVSKSPKIEFKIQKSRNIKHNDSLKLLKNASSRIKVSTRRNKSPDYMKLALKKMGTTPAKNISRSKSRFKTSKTKMKMSKAFKIKKRKMISKSPEIRPVSTIRHSIDKTPHKLKKNKKTPKLKNSFQTTNLLKPKNYIEKNDEPKIRKKNKPKKSNQFSKSTKLDLKFSNFKSAIKKKDAKSFKIITTVSQQSNDLPILSAPRKKKTQKKGKSSRVNRVDGMKIISSSRFKDINSLNISHSKPKMKKKTKVKKKKKK